MEDTNTLIISVRNRVGMKRYFGLFGTPAGSLQEANRIERNSALIRGGSICWTKETKKTPV